VENGLKANAKQRNFGDIQRRRDDEAAQLCETPRRGNRGVHFSPDSYWIVVHDRGNGSTSLSLGNLSIGPERPRSRTRDAMSAAEERFELNLTHARSAYADTQEVIRFVDGKTGIMTGIVTLTTGVPLAILHSSLMPDSFERAAVSGWLAQPGLPRWLSIASISLMLLGFAFGVISLVASTSGLMARRPRTTPRGTVAQEVGRVVLRAITLGKMGAPPPPAALPEVTCLYPSFKPEQRAAALRKFQKLEAGEYDQAEVLKEYSLQLVSVGSILDTKIKRNRQSVRWFEGQVTSYAISIFLAVILIFGYQRPEESKDQLWDPTAPGHAETNIARWVQAVS
jgi:hypothetical protein